MSKFTRREAIQASLAMAGSLALPGLLLASSQQGGSARVPFSFHHDHLFGTSLDLWFHAPDHQQAAAAEQAALQEFERLRQIFSLYDSASELSRLNHSGQLRKFSADLITVLQIYAQRQDQTQGISDPRVGAFVQLWQQAALNQRLPTPDELLAIREQFELPAWHYDPAHGILTRGALPLNLNCVVKGYALDCVRELIRVQFPEIRAGLINLGGDLCAWGNDDPAGGWLIGVQNPATPSDNAAALGVVRLQDASLAGSGSYLRGYTINGDHYSHIIDPRSGQPTTTTKGTTVLASTSVTANLLATTTCVMEPAESLQLLEQLPGVAGIVFPAQGDALQSSGLVFCQITAPEPAAQAAAPSQSWPHNYVVKLELELPKPGGRARRPYVAVWLEDDQGKPVRTLTVWGNSSRWLPEISGWWKIGKADSKLVRAVTRATRAPGKYELEWDGKDDAGQALPQAEYTVKIEVHREHGKHLFQKGKLNCGAAAATLTLDKNAELEETKITYAEKKSEEPRNVPVAP